MTFQNLFSKIKLSSRYTQNDIFHIKGFIVLLVSILFILWLYGFHGADWEILVTKHYWGAEGWFYGGYADSFVKTPQGYRTVQREGLVPYNNLFPFSEKSEPPYTQYRVEGLPSTGRLAVPFLTYLTIEATRGRLNVWDAFYFLNITLWLSSIFLAYQLAKMYFENLFSPFFAALFLVFYPVFTLNFHSLKISYLNTVFLLSGILIFEKKICHMRIYLQFIYFSAIFFLGLFAAGGWLFLFAYLFVRHLNLPRAQRFNGITSMVLALLAAQIALAYLRYLYHLPSAEQQMSFSYGKMLSQSMEWLKTWTYGKDVTNLKFLNYTGFTLFTDYLPLVISAFILGHWMLLLLSIPAWFFVQPTRALILTSVLLFFIGHGGYMITGWIWHYGYLSAPAAMMLILANAGFLGWMASHPQAHLKGLAIFLLAISLFGFMNQKLHAGLYYSGHAESYQPRIILYYGESNDVTEH